MPKAKYFFHQTLTKPVRNWLCFTALILIIVIIFLSLGSVQQVKVAINNMDKLAHGFAYFVLGLVALPALGKIRALYVWAGLSLIGIGLEIAQGVMKSGRQADVFDALANASGALCAVFVWFIISHLLKQRQANP